MEIPLYTLSRKYDAPLTYVEDFTKATFNMMTGQLKGKDFNNSNFKRDSSEIQHQSPCQPS